MSSRSGRAAALLLVALALALLLSSRPAECVSDTVAADADLVVLDLDRDTIRAQGDAALSYQTLSLHADSIVADQQTGRIEATGNLSLSQQGRRLQGERLEYNAYTEEGVLTKARVSEQGIIINGEKIEFSPQALVAHHAYFTTCDRPDPHYAFSANRISLTAAADPLDRSASSEQPKRGGPPQSGQLTLDRARLTYHHRPLFTIPTYSVAVSRLREPRASPFPVTGFSRDDGPFASLSYTVGKPQAKTLGEFSYRYSTFRGIRGHLRLRHNLGSAELFAAYIRREDVADEELHPDQIEYASRSVLVNRAPEYGIRLPDLALGRSLTLHGEWLRGTYSERYSRVVDTRARADRDSLSLLLSSAPYSPAPGLTLSHAIGWRHSRYSGSEQAIGEPATADDLTVRFLRHSLNLTPSPHTHLSLSYITRRGSGQTPFLFDDVGLGRELLADVSFRLNPLWRLRVQEVYDLTNRRLQDIDLAVTRTAHCLDYTFGWRKSRGSFFLGIGLVPATG